MLLKELPEYNKAIETLHEIVARERDIFNASERDLEVKKEAITLLREWLVVAFDDAAFREEQPLESGLENIFVSQSDTQASK